ncbi:hypothetical protein VPH35_068219 [Triticum aestivum]
MDHEAGTSQVHVLDRLLLDENADPTNLPFSLLQDITNHFSVDHQIGSGGFAVVYKGVVGKCMVAVKKLSNTFAVPENKFHEEVRNLIKAKHKNIVRFLGYCADMQGKMEEYEGNLVMADQRNWLLCFEYVCNRSLDKHISGPKLSKKIRISVAFCADASCGLNWRERYQIIRGICEGLLLLHEKRIIHLDLKPANILLEAHMVSKICDFGLSRCLDKGQTRLITKSRCGTLGYMDPEYLRSGRTTFASDIYSLGTVILKILTGVKWYLEEETVVQSWMIRLEASVGDMQLEQVRVCYKIGIECMNLDSKKRPVAHHIIDRLDNMATADCSYETGTNSSLVELHPSLPSEQLGERLTTERLRKADAKEHSKILEDSSCGAQDTKQKANQHIANIFNSISTVFNKLNNLDIFNSKTRMCFNRNFMRHRLEQSATIMIFAKDELKPVLRSSNLIGKGPFDEVYKGVVDNAQVAVRKLYNGNAIMDDQFANEIIIWSQVNHKNIVRLIGCCLEMDTLILVYEFVPRGSLHDILYSNNKVSLSLDVRLTIAAESAQGLAYLHSQAFNQILHGRVKPASILLDDYFTPKISDFDLWGLIARDVDPVYLNR